MSTVVTAYPHIEKPETGPAHLKRFPRIRVAMIVMDYLSHGYSPDEMVKQFPHLTLAEAHAAMVYYYDHKDEIDGEIERETRDVEQWIANHEPAPAVLRLRAIKERNGQ
jgi:uncharacterized protein (DUF433 family)